MTSFGVFRQIQRGASVRALGVLAASALALAPACRKIEHGPPPSGELVGLARTAVDHVPRGTGMVIGVSWAQFRETPLWQSIAPKLLGLEQVKTVLDAFKSGCQIDLVADLEGLMVAANLVGGAGEIDDSTMVVMVKGRWDEDKFGKCLVAMSTQFGGSVTFSKADGYSVFESGAAAEVAGDEAKPATPTGEPGDPAEADAPEVVNNKMYLAWIAPGTFATTIGALQGDTELLGQVLRPTRPLAKDELFVSLLERVDGDDALWFAATPLGLPGLSGKDTKEVKGMYANLRVGPRAHGYFGMRFDTPGRAEIEARGGQDFLAEQKKHPQLAEYLTDSRVYVAGHDVVVEARVSETKVAELAKRLAGMNDGEWLLVLSSLEKLMGGF